MENSKLTTEQILAQYFDPTSLRLPPEPLYRLEGAGLRSYYTYTPPEAQTKPKRGRKTPTAPTKEPKGIVKFYISFTSILHATLPTPPQLIEWMQKQGLDSEQIKNERAAYGTLMHITFERLLTALITKSVFDIDALPADILQYIEDNALTGINWLQWLDMLKQDVLGFAKFVTDYKVKPLAIEIPLKCERLGVAGVLDLPCYMTVKKKGFFGEVYKQGEKKGQPKESWIEEEVLAIVDFKSSRKGCYEENELQLKMHEMAWRENFPEFKDKVIRLYNLRPKDWRTAPDYTLVDQTGKHDDEELELLSKVYYKRNVIGQNERTLIGGLLNFATGECDITKCYTRVNMTEYILNRQK